MAIPKGIRTRNTPDWFALYLSIGSYGVSDLGLTETYKYFGCYNDSTNGWYLGVYGSQYTTNRSPLVDMFWVNGTIGGFVRDASRINPSQPAPPGKMFYLDNGAGAALSNPFATIGGFTPSATAGNFPQFVIPPGWSLVSSSQLKDDICGITLFFVPFADPQLREAR